MAEPGEIERTSRLDEHLEDIRAFHAECKDPRDGRTNLVRVWEKLDEKLKKEGKKLEASYSALTWFCREHGIGVKEKQPARRIVTGPGEEMQHDTSPCTIELGGRKTNLQCASLVLGYAAGSATQTEATCDHSPRLNAIKTRFTGRRLR